MREKHQQTEVCMSQSSLFNILDLLVMDHDYQRECCEVLKAVNVDKKVKLSYAYSFVDTLLLHSKAEQKAVYNPLKASERFRPLIVESEVDHKIINSRARLLIPKIEASEELDEETEIELKVLAKFIESHLRIEEKDLFSLMKKYLDDDVQNEMGFQFFRLRGFTTKDLKNHPELQEELRKLVETPQNGAAASKLLRNIEMKIHHQTA